MDRQEVFGLVRKKYGTEPDYPWGDWNAVLRHKDTGKWYGVILEVKGSRIGLGDERIVDVAIHYMKENMEKHLSLEEISTQIGYSPSHFSMLFKKQTGMTPTDYITSLGH